MEVTKTTNFFGMDISSVNEIYTAEAYGRVFFIHPAVIEGNGGKFEFPVYNVSVIEVTGRKVVITPGNDIMRVFEVDGEKAEIEDVYGSQTMSYYVFDEKDWREKRKAVIIVSSDKKTTIEWRDANGFRWMSTIDINGNVETIPNPNPPPEEDEDE